MTRTSRRLGAPLLALLSLALLPLAGCASAPPEAESAERQPDAPGGDAARAAAAPTDRREPWVSLSIERADLGEVLEALGARVGRTIVTAPEVHETVTVDLKQVHWREAVNVLARLGRCVVEEKPDGAILVSQPPVVTVAGHGSARLTLELLASARQRTISLPPHFPDAVADGLDIRGVEWQQAIERVLAAAGDYEVWDFTAPVLRVMRGDDARRERARK